jgi:hypothetical protein
LLAAQRPIRVSRHYVNDDRLYEDLRAIHVGLLRDIAKEKPFSAVRRACLTQFKTFFMDDFEGEHQMRLYRAYDKLKNKLMQ